MSQPAPDVIAFYDRAPLGSWTADVVPDELVTKRVAQCSAATLRQCHDLVLECVAEVADLAGRQLFTAHVIGKDTLSAMGTSDDAATAFFTAWTREVEGQ